MTVDLSKEQIQTALIDESDQTMATSTMTATNHFKTNISSTSSQDSMELSSRLTQLHLRERQQKLHSDSVETNIPRRQPTIVCEDIADDIDIENDSSEEQTLEAIAGIDQSNDSIGGPLPRSASTASLTVPHSIECDDEKRRPPLPSSDPTHEQMLIEANELSNSS